MKRLILSILLLVSVLSLSVYAQTAATSLILGNPSNATRDESNEDNFLVVHKGFILSYNRSRGTNNWVAWHLAKSDTHNIRTDAFAPDQTLPRAWWILPRDYLRSGYDQGHMCPSDDRSASIEANKESFLMSNMQPQTHRLNAGAWKSLETYVRTQVTDKNMEAYMYAGCYGDAGRIKNKITIPTMCWKIAVLLSVGNNDLRRINADTRVIAVNMDNTRVTRSGWRNHRVTVDELEEITGYEFLAPVADEIENALESKKDTSR